jgi:prefoldin subunit 5
MGYKEHLQLLAAQLSLLNAQLVGLKEALDKLTVALERYEKARRCQDGDDVVS